MPSTGRVYPTKVGFNGCEKYVYEDLQGGAGRVIRPGVTAPTWRTDARQIGGGVAFAALGFAVNDYIDIPVQTRHAVKLNTTIDVHIHYTLPSDDAGKKIKFQVDVIAAPIDADYAVTSGSPYSAEYTLDGTEAGKHKLLDIGDIAAVNTTVSTIYWLQLKRVAASSDDYTPEVYLDFIDCHVKQDTVGSINEDSK